MLCSNVTTHQLVWVYQGHKSSSDQVYNSQTAGDNKTWHFYYHPVKIEPISEQYSVKIEKNIYHPVYWSLQILTLEEK